MRSIIICLLILLPYTGNCQLLGWYAEDFELLPVGEIKSDLSKAGIVFLFPRSFTVKRIPFTSYLKYYPAFRASKAYQETKAAKTLLTIRNFSHTLRSDFYSSVVAQGIGVIKIPSSEDTDESFISHLV